MTDDNRTVDSEIYSCEARCGLRMDSPGFWDGLHAAHPDVNDWYLSADDCAELLKPLLPPSKYSTCLHIGCGTSCLGDTLLKVCPDVTNIDFSEECIRFQRSRMASASYHFADVRDMSMFADGKYDVVVDKGTFDSLQRDADAPTESLKLAVRELMRVTTENALLISLSIIPPKHRLVCLETALKPYDVRIEVAEWGVEPWEMPGQKLMWAYVIQRVG